MDIEKLLAVESATNRNPPAGRMIEYLGNEASFFYGMPDFKAMIIGKWFRNMESYLESPYVPVSYAKPLKKREVFNTLVRRGMWSAFFAAEAELLNEGRPETAYALISLALTESGRYGIPLLMVQADNSPVLPILPELGFREIMDDEEEMKRLFVNKYG